MKRAKHEYPTGKDLVRTMAERKGWLLTRSNFVRNAWSRYVSPFWSRSASPFKIKHRPLGLFGRARSFRTQSKQKIADARLERPEQANDQKQSWAADARLERPEQANDQKQSWAYRPPSRTNYSCRWPHKSSSDDDQPTKFERIPNNR